MTHAVLILCLVALLGLLAVLVKLMWDLHAFHRRVNS